MLTENNDVTQFVGNMFNLREIGHLPNFKHMKLVYGSYILSQTLKIPGLSFTPLLHHDHTVTAYHTTLPT